MSDRYATFTRSVVGRRIATSAGLPQPLVLNRWKPNAPAIQGPVLITSGTIEGDAAAIDPTQLVAAGAIAKAVDAAGADIQVSHADLAGDVIRAATDKQALGVYGATSKPVGSIVVDATAIATSEQLAAVYRALHPTAKKVRSSGRIVVVGLDPDLVTDPSKRIAQRALEGFVRSLGKEIGKGRTVNLILLAPGAETAIESTLRFFLSARSAYVDAQVVRIGAVKGDVAPADWDKPLAGKVALVTGAARGIGAAIAEVLHREGATIVGLDIPPLADDLAATLKPLGGESITLDVTADDAPAELSKQLKALHGTVDIIVHNAGITQDRTLARMKPERWDKVIAVNLVAPQRLTDKLIADKVVAKDARVIGLASIAGIAGNNGQTNYGASKAGMIGFVEAYADTFAKTGGTINAVAPGFIETQMTAAIPLTIREAGRRLTSLSQGGLPVDVAETIAWFASPGSAGVNGRVVRVCGQSLIGA
ncbi:MAG: 3-oxoacyl-ACP reductase [Solirubrobacteraceae bacterium]|nr:3-oxoacyl-ACP reductase [Patulibacter sp.]